MMTLIMMTMANVTLATSSLLAKSDDEKVDGESPLAIQISNYGDDSQIVDDDNYNDEKW